MNFEKFKDTYQKVPVEEYPNRVLEVIPNPQVSCIVIAYQHANYIRNCIDSILMQKTSFPFEILIGDDESKDGTRQICLEYAEKHPDKIRLFLHRRENNIKLYGGFSGRFNNFYCRYKARGKYIAQSDGDDYWTDPYKLQKQTKFMEKHESCMLSGHKVSVFSNDGTNTFIYKHKPGFVDLKDELTAHQFPTCSTMFRKIDEYPESFFNPKIMSGDRSLCMYLLAKGKGYIFDETMGVHTRHQEGITQSHTHKNGINRHNSDFLRLEALIKDGEVSGSVMKIIRKKVDYHLLVLSKSSLKKMNLFSAFIYLFKYIKNKFFLFPLTFIK